MADKHCVVYVDVIYRFLEREQTYEATVKSYLPAKDGLIMDILLNENKKFFGRELEHCWGKRATDREDYRVATSFYYADDIPTLKEKVKEKINHEIKVLKDVVDKNVLASNELPEPEHYEYVI